jgi:hypothetical protein
MVLKTVSTLGGGGGAGGGTPGGANTQVQFNSSGSFGGSANLTWDGANVQVGSSGLLKLSNGVTNYVAFKASNVIPANVTWTLPSTDGTSGQFMITNGSGTLSWATANLTPVAPTNYSLPEVSGTTTVGQTLSSTTGGWNGYPAPTYAYQWVRGASNIGGATSATYPLVDADYNNTIKVIVTATNSAGSANATSNATATIAGTVPGAPTIGTATAGNAQASVAFTAPAVTGGPSITSYTATSSPGSITGSAASSPITVSGLTNGTAYTFTVTATNSIGTGAASAASNSVTPSAIVQDASFAYVPLLLETTSTNGQQNNTFLDSSTNALTITRTGTPTQGSITPYWTAGQWSNYFSSSYLSVADSASLRFGASNFTIEAWVFRTASGATHTIAVKGASTPTGWVFQISSADKLVFIDTSTSITGTTSLAANTWYYVAVVRAGTGSNQTTLYVNGASDGTGTSATTFSQTDAMRIGTDRSAANGFAGYVSNLRLSNTNLTISSTPTSPLTALGSTIFLSCGYNRFVDGSSLNSAITIGTGTPTVQAFQPFSPTASYTTALYGGSGYFPGSSYLSVASNAALALGTGDFTIEFWIYPIVIPGASVFTSIYVLGASLANTMFINFRGSGTIGLTDGSSVYATTASPLVANNWYHIAVVRSSGSSKIYTNGVGGTAVACATNFAQDFATIAYDSINAAFNGYLSNLRVIKGTAVYTGNFTPPTLAPLTTAGSTSAASYSSTTNVNTSFASSATSLLTNFTNAGIYDAAAQNDVTTVGDAQSSTTQKQWGTTSMKYDGTGDWLTAVDNPQLQLGTGNFTIEGWVYLSAVSVAYGILSKGTATTGWSVNVTALNKLQFSYTTSNLTGTTSLATGTWYYFAVVRSGSATGNLKLYLNASLEATSGGAVTDNFNQTSILYVGADRIGTSALNGYLQDVRITKAARAITLPTASFPVQ